jgi:LysM repeat protein
MSRRVLVGYVILNVVVSLAVAGIVALVYDSTQPDVEPIMGPTQIIYITATPPPGSSSMVPEQYIGTIGALQLTATALSQNTPVVVTPAPDTGSSPPGVPQEATIATIPPEFLPPIPTNAPSPGPGESTEAPEAAEAADDGCIYHVVESGDVIIAIAQQYGVFPGDILTANNLTPDDLLQIGDVLTIPVEGCAALVTPSPTPEPTNTPFQLTRVAATVTLPPTAINAQVTITSVLNPGDVNNEAVELRNDGSVLNLQGWTLTNGEETFRFPEARMQPGSRVRIFTRQGPNTPAALYWGRDTAAWTEGDTLTLADDTGGIQATFTIGEPSDLFEEATPVPDTGADSDEDETG